MLQQSTYIQIDLDSGEAMSLLPCRKLSPLLCVSGTLWLTGIMAAVMWCSRRGLLSTDAPRRTVIQSVGQRQGAHCRPRLATSSPRLFKALRIGFCPPAGWPVLSRGAGRCHSLARKGKATAAFNSSSAQIRRATAGGHRALAIGGRFEQGGHATPAWRPNRLVAGLRCAGDPGFMTGLADAGVDCFARAWLCRRSSPPRPSAFRHARYGLDAQLGLVAFVDVRLPLPTSITARPPRSAAQRPQR